MTDNGVTDVKTIWDIPIDSLYPLVLEFYRKEKSQIALDYGQRNKLLAYYKQAKLGPHTADKEIEPGYFDVIGSDRRKAWKTLGDMSQDEARRGLVALLDAATPQVREYALAEWRRQGSTGREEGRKADERQEVPAGIREEDQEEQVDAGRGELRPHMDSSVNGHPSPPPSMPLSTATRLPAPEPKTVLAPAALWCSPKAARQFISQIEGSPESQLVVGGGETVSIQVPTSTDASSIFWQFVTNSGNIGFGLKFQREDEEETDHEWPVEELLPAVRRDCSEDLVLGSHTYQTQGTYFLVFDNSLSPDTQKVVYYKVFYQKSA